MTNATTDFPEYPVGSFLHTEKGYFYVYSKTQRYRFITKRVLDSWNPQRVLETTEHEPAVMRLRIFAKMKFRNGTLLYSYQRARIYLVSENKLRPLSTDSYLFLTGGKESPVRVSEEELNLHELGNQL